MSHKNHKSPSKIRYNQYFNYMRETSEVVNKYIEKLIDEQPDQKEILLPPFHGRLYKPKLRGFALRLSYEIVGGENWEKIAPASAAVELLDTSHYAADDILDTEIDDKQQVNNLLISSHILYSLSQEMLVLLKKDFSDTIVLQTLEESNKLHKAIQKGFHYEEFIINKYNLKANLKRLENYTFWGSLMSIGAILGNANKKEVDALKAFGKNIGIAYTLANDTCDIAKKQEDLRSGKITIPLSFALKNSDSENYGKIEKCLGNWNCPESEMHDAINSIIASGAIQTMKDIATEYVGKALQELGIFEDTKIKQLLGDTARIVHHNKYYIKINRITEFEKIAVEKEIHPDLIDDLNIIKSL